MEMLPSLLYMVLEWCGLLAQTFMTCSCFMRGPEIHSASDRAPNHNRRARTPQKGSALRVCSVHCLMTLIVITSHLNRCYQTCG